MQHLEDEFRRLGKGNLADIIASVHKLNVSDIPFSSVVTPVEASSLPTKAASFEVELLPTTDDVLSKAIAEFRTNPFSPEAVTKFWKAKLQADGKRIGLEISVPDCNWTEEEIKRSMKDNKGNEVLSMLVYVPEQLTGKEGLVKLGQMYPKMGNWSVREGTTVQDNPDANKKGGWIKVEATVDAPNLNTTRGDLGKHAKEQGYFGQRENVYILASQASKDLTGHYLDEGPTWSRLGSHGGGGVVDAYFDSDGRLDIDWPLDPRLHDAGMGGRFEEVKKA